MFILVFPETSIKGSRIAIGRVLDELATLAPFESLDPSPNITVSLVDYPQPSVQTVQDLLRTANHLLQEYRDEPGIQVVDGQPASAG